jgi:hypothetical protein
MHKTCATWLAGGRYACKMACVFCPADIVIGPGLLRNLESYSDVTAGEIVPVALTAKVISVNGVQLDEVTIQRLETAYRTRLVNGNFWYDPVSGLWAFGAVQRLGRYSQDFHWADG